MLELLHNVLGVVIPLLGTAGAGVIVWLFRRKFNLQITAQQELALANIIHKAIGFAEEWAYQQKKSAVATSVSGEDKLAHAVSFAKTELARARIKIPEDEVNRMMHAALGLMRGRR